MEIHKAYNPASLNITNIVRARYNDGRIAVPVRRSHLLYSNLKHISGVPAVGGSSGYSITLLRRLDNLIDSLVDVKSARPYVRDVSGLSEGDLASMVRRYEADLHNTITRAPAGISARAQGVLLDVFA